MSLVFKIFMFIMNSFLIYIFFAFLRNEQVTELLLKSVDKIHNDIVVPSLYKNIILNDSIYEQLIKENQENLVWNPFKWNKTEFEDIIDMKLYNKLQKNIKG